MFFDKTANKKKTSKKYIILSIGLSLSIIFLFKNIFNFLNINFYNSYINRINSSDISLSYFIMYIPTILILIFMKTKDALINTFKSLLISGYIIGLVGTTAIYLNRISLYFNFFEIILIPYLIEKINNKRTRAFIITLYVIYLILFFVYQYYYLGRHEIFPYKSWLFN